MEAETVEGMGVDSLLIPTPVDLPGQETRLNLERQHNRCELVGGTYWDRLVWPQIRVILLGARSSGSILSILPSDVVHKIILIAHRPRWLPKFTTTTKLARGSTILERTPHHEVTSILAFRCSSTVRLSSLPSIRLDGEGLQYFELVLGHADFGTSVALFDDAGTQSVSIEFTCSECTHPSEYGFVDDSTVEVDFSGVGAPAQWYEQSDFVGFEAITKTSAELAAIRNGAAHPYQALSNHVAAWNNWDSRFQTEPAERWLAACDLGVLEADNFEGWNMAHRHVRMGCLFDFDAKLARFSLNGAPGPVLPFAYGLRAEGEDDETPVPMDASTLRMGLQGFYGDDKRKYVHPDGSIQLARVRCALRVPDSVPANMVSEDLAIDEGTCDHRTCLHCQQVLQFSQELRAPAGAEDAQSAALLGLPTALGGTQVSAGAVGL